MTYGTKQNNYIYREKFAPQWPNKRRRAAGAALSRLGPIYLQQKVCVCMHSFCVGDVVRAYSVELRLVSQLPMAVSNKTRDCAAVLLADQRRTALPVSCKHFTYSALSVCVCCPWMMWPDQLRFPPNKAIFWLSCRKQWMGYFSSFVLHWSDQVIAMICDGIFIICAPL